jgi:hypothetical protein
MLEIPEGESTREQKIVNEKSLRPIQILALIIYLFIGLGFKFRASPLANQALYCFSHIFSPVHFALFVWRWGSLELFAWAGLEL